MISSSYDAQIAVLDEEVAVAEAMLQEAILRRAAFIQQCVLADLNLRQWQFDALSAWQLADHRGVVEAVTGAGKTRLGIAAVALAHNAGMRSVILVPSVFLMDQWVAELSQLLPDLKVVRSLDKMTTWDVCVTTVQTAHKRDFLLSGEQALLVADEVHRYGAEKFSEALRDGYTRRLGLSATSERGDDGDAVIESYFGEICFKLDYGRALSEELISPYVFGFIRVPLTKDERVKYDEFTATIRRLSSKLIAAHGFPSDDSHAFERQVIKKASVNETGSEVARVCQAYLSATRERRALLASAQMKLSALSSLAPAINSSNGVIVFTQTTEASTRAAEMINAFGARAEAISSVMPMEDRQEALLRFRDRGAGGVDVLATPKILDEGVDVPEADMGIVMAANRSRRQMIQRLGRVLRRRPGKVARLVVMCAEGTVEEPRELDAVDYYGEIIPHAADWGVFSANDAGDQLNLLRMLAGRTVDAVEVEAGQGAELSSEGHSSLLPDQIPEKVEVPAEPSPIEVEAPRLPQPVVGSDQHYYRLKGRGERSLGYLLPDGRFTVTRGNELLNRGWECGPHGMDLDPNASERCLWIARTRSELLSSGVLGWVEDGLLVFLEDHVFTDADDASDVIKGKDVDGFAEWEDDKGRPLHQVGATRRRRAATG